MNCGPGSLDTLTPSSRILVLFPGIDLLHRWVAEHTLYDETPRNLGNAHRNAFLFVYPDGAELDLHVIRSSWDVHRLAGGLWTGCWTPEGKLDINAHLETYIQTLIRKDA
jgi:hypothetical protein